MGAFLKNKKSVILASIFVTCCVLLWATYYILQSATTKKNVVEATPQTNEQTKIEKEILWSKPTKRPDLKLTKTVNELGQPVNTERYASTTYYTIGSIISGPYKGGELIYITIPVVYSDESGGKYRVIKLENRIILLTNHSQSDGFYLLDPKKFTTDSTTTLSDLTFPEKLTYKGTSLSFQGTNWAESLFDDEYNQKDLKKVFSDTQLGDVYTDASSTSFDKDGYERNAQNGFYIRAPDGTIRVYSLDINFYDKNRNIPHVTWNNGSTTIAEYINTDRGGCGSSNYTSVKTNITRDDLTQVGVTSFGDPIYELKNTDSELLKNIYNKEYNPYDYSATDRTKPLTKISYEKFIQSHPVFFWYDPFGRLVKFQKSEYVPQAECGKPVIYLYPEKTIPVSVKVAPQGGFTKTIPEYGNGWNVVATPKSEITDNASGKTFPYLFWEGRGGIYETPKKGFIITQKEVPTFLVEKLTKLGLNQKEQADFIEFWEPRMTGAPYYFVTFLGNSEMNKLAPLTIDPKPDTVIRILMDFMPLRERVPAIGYEIKTPPRKGFTVVEWGGVIR